MHMYITSRGRARTQYTLGNLPRKLRNNVVLVVPRAERKEYEAIHSGEVVCVGPNIETLSMKRQWLVRYHRRTYTEPRLIMLDDDLSFAVRRTDDRTKFKTASDNDISTMFEYVWKELLTAAHAGILAREGGNRATLDKIVCARMMRILGYNSDILAYHKIRFDRLPVMSDFDVTLQLLRAGYLNTVFANWVQDQRGGSNAPGGCSTYRTKKLLKETAHRLAALHKPFVTIEEKVTKGAWGGGTRTDVRIAWKKAYASSQH